MDVVDLTLSDSDNETVCQTDRRKLPAWSITESFGLPQKSAVDITSFEPRNSDGAEAHFISQAITSTSNTNEACGRPSMVVQDSPAFSCTTISVDEKNKESVNGRLHFFVQTLEVELSSMDLAVCSTAPMGLDGETLCLGENPASVSTAANPFSEIAIDRRCLPPSLMHGKPIPGSSGVENNLTKWKKKEPYLHYQNEFVNSPQPRNGSGGQLGLYFKADPGSNSKVYNVLSGLHSHENHVLEVADRQTSNPSSQDHNCSYINDYGRPFNDKSVHLEGGKVVQNVPRAYSIHGSNDEILIYENVSSRRQLPVTLLNEKHAGTSLPAGHGEVTHCHGTGEEKLKETDERLIFQAALEGLAQPNVEASLPDGLLSVPLLRHQKIALAWMVYQETRSFHCAGGILADDQGLGKTVSTIALILMQRDQHSKFISDSMGQVKRETLNLDDDGDGSAELSNNEQHKNSDNQSKAVVNSQMTSIQKGRPAAGTLIVCPASVLRQWAQELSNKVADDAKLLFLVYYGPNRTKDPFELAKYDVILTTYSIVSMEVPKQPLFDEDDVDQTSQEKYGLSSDFIGNKKKAEHKNKKMKKSKKCLDGLLIGQEISPLARVRWFRVVLDEAQTIKNYRTQVSRACCGLRAKRRWCLSGTPIQNAIDDLYSYFRFLKYDPYSAYKSFCTAIKYPISRNSSNGYKKLQAVLRTMLLRRTKGTLIDGEPIINLPPRSVCLKKIEFSLEERIFYSNLEAESRLEFKTYEDEGTVSKNYANILLLLLRLRQACDHPLLVQGYRSDSSNKLSTEGARKHPKDMLMTLLKQLESSSAICAICSDPPEDAVITICSHIFCNQCISERLTSGDNLCPSAGCRNQISNDSIFSRFTLQSAAGHSNTDNDSNAISRNLEDLGVGPSAYRSSKIKAALDILLSLNMEQANYHTSSAGYDVHVSDYGSDKGYSADLNTHILPSTKLSTQVARPEKAIVFSQWTSMLDLLEISLKNSCINYRRLDGTMSLAARDKAVREFNTLPEVTVMIMSLKAGNLGLNMVAANHVVLLDLWWNPTTEDQAIDRAHRIGQTRPVIVSRLTIQNTIEDRILALQEEKRKMVTSAFAEDQTGSFATRLTVEDLRYLFMV